MTLDIFKRATKAALTILGEGSFLRGVACKVAIEHGVQTYGIDGSGNQIVVENSIATISKLDAPQVGDALTHPDGNYILDALSSDDGCSADFVIRKA